MATLRRSSSSYGAFADGIIIRGMPLATLYPGNIFWVDSAGGGGSKGTFAHPVATIAEAFALVTSDNGDIICVKPGHAESLTATVDFASKSGFAIVGLGFGDNRPTITMAHTAADDGWDFDGDDVVIYNIKFTDSAAGGADVVAINCSGDNMHFENCYFALGSETMTAITHDTTNKKGFTFIGNTIYGREAGPDVVVRFEKTHFNAYFTGNKYLFGVSVGCDTGCIVFVSGTTGGNHLIVDELVSGLANAEPFIHQAVIQVDSLCMGARIIGDDATDNLAVSTASGFGFIDCMVTEPGKGVPGQSTSFGGGGYRPYATTPAKGA